jgi:two-component system, chemotaxis family, chemotaxis protein CheY
VNPTYLVVDDSRLHHQMYDLIFARPALAGGTVLHAFDGREGYGLLCQHPELSLVLLDLNMPVMNGLEFLVRRFAESRHLHVPVVLVTTESTAEDEARGLSAGAAGYLRKPFTPEQLEGLVTDMLSRAPAARTA